MHLLEASHPVDAEPVDCLDEVIEVMSQTVYDPERDRELPTRWTFDRLVSEVRESRDSVAAALTFLLAQGRINRTILRGQRLFRLEGPWGANA